MTMIFTICAVIDTLILLFLALVAVWALLIPAKEKAGEAKTEARVEQELKRDFMDEGFENIMAYSVGGRNGFDDSK